MKESSEVFQEIAHHQSAIELLQNRIAYHLQQMELCEKLLVESGVIIMESYRERTDTPDTPR